MSDNGLRCLVQAGLDEKKLQSALSTRAVTSGWYHSTQWHQSQTTKLFGSVSGHFLQQQVALTPSLRDRGITKSSCGVLTASVHASALAPGHRPPRPLPPPSLQSLPGAPSGISRAPLRRPSSVFVPKYGPSDRKEEEPVRRSRRLRTGDTALLSALSPRQSRPLSGTAPHALPELSFVITVEPHVHRLGKHRHHHVRLLDV